jgi:hypothetical protein
MFLSSVYRTFQTTSPLTCWDRPDYDLSWVRRRHTQSSNGLVDSFGTGPHNAKRDPRNLVDPNLLSCLEVLVNLVAKLHVSITLTLSTSQPCIGSAELALVKEMVDALTLHHPVDDHPGHTDQCQPDSCGRVVFRKSFADLLGCRDDQRFGPAPGQDYKGYTTVR